MFGPTAPTSYELRARFTSTNHELRRFFLPFPLSSGFRGRARFTNTVHDLQLSPLPFHLCAPFRGRARFTSTIHGIFARGPNPSSTRLRLSNCALRSLVPPFGNWSLPKFFIAGHGRFWPRSCGALAQGVALGLRIAALSGLRVPGARRASSLLPQRGSHSPARGSAPGSSRIQGATPLRVQQAKTWDMVSSFGAECRTTCETGNGKPEMRNRKCETGELGARGLIRFPFLISAFLFLIPFGCGSDQFVGSPLGERGR